NTPRRRSVIARCRFALGFARSPVAGTRNWRRWRSSVCARTVHARYRSAVCRRARPIAVEPHGDERDHAATVGGIRGVCQPRSVRVRGDLPVRRRPCRAAASGATARGGAGRLGCTGGRPSGAAALGPGEQGGHGELLRVLPRPAPGRLARSVAGRLRRRAWPDPHDRGMLPALGAPALPRPQAAQPAEQDARGSVAGVRTTNLLERLFGEERRRTTKVIPHAFGERAVLKLLYVALIRAPERWRAFPVPQSAHPH